MIDFRYVVVLTGGSGQVRRYAALLRCAPLAQEGAYEGLVKMTDRLNSGYFPRTYVMIRKASLKDIPSILELVNENLGTLLPRSHNDYADLIESTYICEKDGRIVGSCVLEIYSPKIAEIRSFVVHSDYRRQGVGKALIAEAVAEGRKRNIREIMVVTSAREYFEKQNFGACLNEKFALFWNGR